MNALAQTPPTILVVEDDPHLAAGVAENLRAEGYTVFHVADGREALEWMRAHRCELVVRDTGVGFRPADCAQLFKKFSRLHPASGGSYYGTGLGLFIVRRMMQLAGGRVSAHSDGVGQGAQFVLAWPVAPMETQ